MHQSVRSADFTPSDSRGDLGKECEESPAEGSRVSKPRCQIFKEKHLCVFVLNLSRFLLNKPAEDWKMSLHLSPRDVSVVLEVAAYFIASQ